jgi:hypothetical protein
MRASIFQEHGWWNERLGINDKIHHSFIGVGQRRDHGSGRVCSRGFFQGEGGALSGAGSYTTRHFSVRLNARVRWGQFCFGGSSQPAHCFPTKAFLLGMSIVEAVVTPYWVRTASDKVTQPRQQKQRRWRSLYHPMLLGSSWRSRLLASALDCLFCNV